MKRRWLELAGILAAVAVVVAFGLHSEPAAVEGLRLGMTRAQAIAARGEPNRSVAEKGNETLTWVGPGEQETFLLLEDGRVREVHGRALHVDGRGTARSGEGLDQLYAALGPPDHYDVSGAHYRGLHLRVTTDGSRIDSFHLWDHWP